jgi:hypothetical protein
MEEVRKQCKEAVKIDRDRTLKNPQTCSLQLAMILNNLRTLHSSQRRMEKAGKEYKGAPKIDPDLTQNKPKTYMLQRAKALRDLRKPYFENPLSAVPKNAAQIRG